MKVITESDLRMKYYKNNDSKIYVQKGDFLTQTAKEYIRDKGLEIVIEEDDSNYKVMGQEIIRKKGNCTYVDIEGNCYDEKPEHMTALNGNLLVPKSHPRIAFRGKMDTLQGKIIGAQIAAQKNNCFGVIDDLEEILAFARNILSCEVKEEFVNIPVLLGLDSESLRNVSHNPKKYYGTNHYMPSYKMGETVVVLNSLRTIVRETELAAVNAFKNTDGTIGRLDLIKALNRISSAVYIISCRLLAGYYGKS